MKESIVKNKSFEFAMKIVDLYKVMISKNEYVLSKQLLRSGTSIGANIEEGLAGQSHRDFTHKMSISSKEARESLYWLKLIEYGKFVPEQDLNQLKKLNMELIKMLTAIVKSSQQKMNKRKD